MRGEGRDIWRLLLRKIKRVIMIILKIKLEVFLNRVATESANNTPENAAIFTPPTTSPNNISLILN